MKKLLAAIILVTVCLTGCAKEEKWHPESTEVVFDTQQLTVEKIDENTDFCSGEMEYYMVTATAKSDTAPFYNLTMTALIGIKYYPGQYPNIRDEKYSGYVVKSIEDVCFYGGGENMQWTALGDSEIFTDIQPSGDTAVLWLNGYYHTEHDKKVKNVSDYLPGMFFKYDTTVKEHFSTDMVSFFIKLYVEEIIQCNPRQYHLTVECSTDGVTHSIQ